MNTAHQALRHTLSNHGDFCHGSKIINRKCNQWDQNGVSSLKTHECPERQSVCHHQRQDTGPTHPSPGNTNELLMLQMTQEPAKSKAPGAQRGGTCPACLYYRFPLSALTGRW